MNYPNLLKPFFLLTIMLLPLQTFALQKQMYTIPIKFPIVNPCNGDTVKVSGKLKEIITVLDKSNLLIQHNTDELKAIGASKIKYTVKVDKEFANVTFPSEKNHVLQPGFTYKMLSENTDVVPNFSITQDMTTTLNPNGAISLSFTNFKTICDK